MMTPEERAIARERWKIVINGTTFYPEDFMSGGVSYSGFYDFSNMNQKVYQTEPARGTDFTMPDINDIATAEPPQLKIEYKYMTIETFRKMKQATKANEFVVSYYDFEYDTRRTMKMYVHPPDMPKFTTWTLDKLAAYDLSLTFVATMNDISLVGISYNANGGIGVIDGVSGYFGEQVVLSDGSGYGRIGYKLDHWNTALDGSGTDYPLGSTTQLNTSMVLYAVWVATTQFTLSFDYMGAVKPEGANEADWIASKSVNSNAAIGVLPNPTRSGYGFGGWWDYSGTRQFLAADNYGITGNVTAYAKWIEV